MKNPKKINAHRPSFQSYSHFTERMVYGHLSFWGFLYLTGIYLMLRARNQRRLIISGSSLVSLTLHIIVWKLLLLLSYCSSPSQTFIPIHSIVDYVLFVLETVVQRTRYVCLWRVSPKPTLAKKVSSRHWWSLVGSSNDFDCGHCWLWSRQFTYSILPNEYLCWILDISIIHVCMDIIGRCKYALISILLKIYSCIFVDFFQVVVVAEPDVVE